MNQTFKGKSGFFLQKGSFIPLLLPERPLLQKRGYISYGYMLYYIFDNRAQHTYGFDRVLR